LTGFRTGSSDVSGCAEAGFLDGLLPADAVVAAFLGLLALGTTALISTFSLNSSICIRC